MNRIYLFLFLLFVIFLAQFFSKEYILNKLIEVKKEFVLIKNRFNTYLDAVRLEYSKIKELQAKNLELENDLAKLNSLLYDYKDLKLLKPSKLTLTKTISYAALPDFTKIYVDYNKSFSTPRGLIYNNLVAGVLIKSLGSSALGYLVLNKEVSFTVFIGEDEIPGIFKDGKINFIPKFKKIRVGDIVITSGLDGIFYKGVLVGRVKNISQKKLYQEAEIELFYDKLNPNYFYVYEGAGNGYDKH